MLYLPGKSYLIELIIYSGKADQADWDMLAKALSITSSQTYYNASVANMFSARDWQKQLNWKSFNSLTKFLFTARNSNLESFVSRNFVNLRSFSLVW